MFRRYRRNYRVLQELWRTIPLLFGGYFLSQKYLFSVKKFLVFSYKRTKKKKKKEMNRLSLDEPCEKNFTRHERFKSKISLSNEKSTQKRNRKHEAETSRHLDEQVVPSQFWKQISKNVVLISATNDPQPATTGIQTAG